MTKRQYNITSPAADSVREDIWMWIVCNIPADHYSLYEKGFLINEYFIIFHNDESEVYFNLIWADNL